MSANLQTRDPNHQPYLCGVVSESLALLLSFTFKVIAWTQRRSCIDIVWRRIAQYRRLILNPFRLVSLSLVLVCLFAWSAYGERIDVLTLSGQTIEFYTDYHALVVGVGRYDHWPLRPHAVQDARDVSWEFRRLGMSVKLLTDPTIEALRSALDEFTRDYGKEPHRGLIFYFTGHSQSHTTKDGVKSAWLITKDTPQWETDRQDFEQIAFSIDEISAAAERVQSKHMLFLFDAALSAGVFQVEPAVMKVVSDASALPTRQFITAGGADESVLENSPFKHFLVRGLTGEADLIQDGIVSGSELSVYLADRVSKMSGGRLHPLVGRLSAGANLGGDFVIQLNERPLKIARLFVESQPVTAKPRILNIKPRFTQGMELAPGSYRLYVSAEGHDAVEKVIDLKAGEDRTVKIQLTQAKQKLVNSLGMQFMRIRPGSFMMGSPSGEAGRSNDETQHRVRLTQRFYMQSTEVTVGQFKKFIQSSGHRTDAEKGGGCWITGGGQGWTQQKGSSWKKPGSIKINSDLPALCVTWNDARAFARWLSRKEGRAYRLPTEAEWEYAGRAGITTPFSSGRCLSTDEANYGKTGYQYQKCTTVFRKKRGRPIKAGQLSANPWQLHNIHGNVSEWCQDWYGSYPSGTATDPKGPSIGSERVMRGGHWQADAAGSRSAKRRRFPPNLASDAVGFRLVLEP